MEIRKYTSGDLSEILKLFGDTVRTVNARDYTPEQIGAWVSNIDAQRWDSSLSEHYSLVAVIDGKIVGFGDTDASGYLDRLYVHADYQRRGIAAAICSRLEQYAASINADKIVTHASITAKPFFEKRGYVVVKQQQVERAGVLLTNYVMERSL
ncbi:MAG: GNAT family N-acetyltransferase [Acutalibacteraceae bacterium]